MLGFRLTSLFQLYSNEGDFIKQWFWPPNLLSLLTNFGPPAKPQDSTLCFSRYQVEWEPLKNCLCTLGRPFKCLACRCKPLLKKTGYSQKFGWTALIPPHLFQLFCVTMPKCCHNFHFLWRFTHLKWGELTPHIMPSRTFVLIIHTGELASVLWRT